MAKRVHPEYAVSKTLQLLKSNSSRWINQLGVLRGKSEWQRGYGAFSVSHSHLENVKPYIAIQRKHHRNKTFEEDLLETLRKHDIAYDPIYVFDSEFTS